VSRLDPVNIFVFCGLIAEFELRNQRTQHFKYFPSLRLILSFKVAELASLRAGVYFLYGLPFDSSSFIAVFPQFLKNFFGKSLLTTAANMYPNLRNSRRLNGA